MKIQKKMEIHFWLRPEWQITLLFFMGIVGGTVYGNLVGEEMLFAGLSLSFMLYTDIDKKELFHTVFWQRMAETILLWIAGMTEFSVVLVLCMVFGYGFFSGMFLTVCVLQKEMTGILLFWGMMLPQQLLYVPVWYQMSLWAYRKNYHYRWLGLLSAVFIIVLGSLAESCLNPLLLRFLLRKIS